MSGDSPRDVQGPLDLGLDGAQQVGAHLLQQLGEQDEEPVLQVLLVDQDEVHQGLQEHAEHLQRDTVCAQQGVTHTKQIHTDIWRYLGVICSISSYLVLQLYCSYMYTLVYTHRPRHAYAADTVQSLSGDGRNNRSEGGVSAEPR